MIFSRYCSFTHTCIDPINKGLHAKSKNVLMLGSSIMQSLLLFVFFSGFCNCLSGITTLYVPQGSTNVDLQDMINLALQNLGTETEAEIIIESSVITIQPDYSLPDPYSFFNSLSINIGASNLDKLNIRGVSTAQHASIILQQDNVCPDPPLTLFTVIGNTAEDKEVSFQYLTLQYVGTYVNVVGIEVESGLDKLKVESCMFSDMGTGIALIAPPYESTAVQNTNINSNVFVPSESQPALYFRPFLLNFKGSSSQTPINASIIVTNNTISGYPAYWGDINMWGGDNVYLDVSENYFRDSIDNNTSANLVISSYGTGNVITDVQNNEFINGRILIQGLSGNVTNNKFYTLNNRTLTNQLDLAAVTTNQNVSIHSNNFSGACQAAIKIAPIGGFPEYATLSVAIDQNSFINSGQAIRIDTQPDYLNGPSIINSLKNNLFACGGDPFSVLPNPGTITLDPPIVVSHCFFLNSFPNNSSFLVDHLTCISTSYPGIVPEPENHTYSLKWDETMRSPLILKGFDDRYNEYINNYPDIGAVQYEEHPHQYITYTFPAASDRDGIKWMSFPALDRIYGDEDMAYTFFNPLRDNSILRSISWKILNDPIDNLQVFNNEWDGTNHTIQPQVGYKIQMSPSLLNPVSISTPAIKPDPSQPITLKARRNQRSDIPDNENWLGYFGDVTAHPFDAFAGILDNLWFIQAQNWTLARLSVSLGSPWISIGYPGSKTPSLKYGDMVIVKCFEDAEFIWNEDAPESEPFIREKPLAFSFTEKMDYIPVYVEFSGTEIPREAAVYLEGVCKGAAVVGGNSVEIPAYILEDLAPGMELELRVYYDTKAVYNPIPRYQTWNMETGQYENHALMLKERKPYYMLKMDADSINDTPAPKLYLGNYPNPFNPDTTLRFSLPETADVALEVYNVKGQKIRSLIHGSYPAGTHTCLWDAKDNTGSSVASGIYFAMLSYHGKQKSRKLLLLK